MARFMRSISMICSVVTPSPEKASVNQIRNEGLCVSESLASLLLVYFGGTEFVQNVEASQNEEYIEDFAKALATFTDDLAQFSPQLANRLDITQKSLHALFPNISSKVLRSVTLESQDLGEAQIGAIVDSDFPLTRGGLFVLLDANFTGLPFLTDNSLLAYLQTRYNGDHPSLLVDLIVSTFDVFAGAVRRGEPTDRTFMVRSFLVNKLPTLMLAISAISFMPVEFDRIIAQAVGRLDPMSFTSFSQDQDFGPSNNGNKDTTALYDTRQEFLAACILHQMIPEDSIERLTGENIKHDASPRRKLHSQMIIQEYSQSTQKWDQLTAGLKLMDGNTTARAEAISQMFKRQAGSLETMALKELCRHLSQDPLYIDAIAVHSSLPGLLQPLAQLLVDWKHEDNQGEHQPMYEEFSTCLLFLLASAHRYNFDLESVGITPGSTSLHKLIRKQTPQSLPLQSLSADQKRHLGEWLRNLFVTEGISDELMSSCSPQEYYSLVPTMFHQVVNACRSSLLSLEAQMNGLELFLEPFLLPSLVPALNWICLYIWQNPGDLDTLMPLLQKLIRPASLHRVSAAMHSTVLSIVGPSVARCLTKLRSMPQADKHETDLDLLLDCLRLHLNHDRTGPVSSAEIDEWTTTHVPRAAVQNDVTHISLLEALRTSFGALCYWSSATSSTNSILLPPLPTFTYRQLRVAIRIFGPSRVLNALLEESKTQSESGFSEHALDLSVALILSDHLYPSHCDFPANHGKSALAVDQSRSSAHPNYALLQALRLTGGDAAKLILKDPVKAELGVRILRKVVALATSFAPTVSASMTNGHEHGAIDMAIGSHESMMQGIDLGDAVMADVEADVAHQHELTSLPAGADESSIEAALGFDGGASLQLDINSALATTEPDAHQPGQDQAAHSAYHMPESTEFDSTAAPLASATGSVDDIFGDLDLDPSMDFT
ncbi:MAG: mediator complex subunit [Chrysothrix sp. TS-e1954]|nr:MAG: mediator complex subunit [Chrysothrix sp. TS-e1954]